MSPPSHTQDWGRVGHRHLPRALSGVGRSVKWGRSCHPRKLILPFFSPLPALSGPSAPRGPHPSFRTPASRNLPRWSADARTQPKGGAALAAQPLPPRQGLGLPTPPAQPPGPPPCGAAQAHRTNPPTSPRDPYRPLRPRSPAGPEPSRPPPPAQPPCHPRFPPGSGPLPPPPPPPGKAGAELSRGRCS